MTVQSQASNPGHICIIMDGNGRWARQRLMPRSFGHRQGVDATRRCVEFFANAGVDFLTLFVFSSENWKRPEEEVSNLMELFTRSLQRYTDELHDKGLRIRFIGNRDRFADKLRQQIEQTELKTVDNRGMTLIIAANYGGHWDIVNAARELATRVQDGEISIAQIDDRQFASGLALGEVPSPDLFIRTGGEQRISNFLLWNLAYAELWFCDALWPDFGEQEFDEALAFYAHRQRRYGHTGEQVEAIN